MLSIAYTNQFKKDFKKIQKRGLNLSELQKLIELIVNEHPIPAKYKNHKLIGDYKDVWDCHNKTRLLAFVSNRRGKQRSDFCPHRQSC